MSAHQHILPGNATPFERALSETGDFLPGLGPQAETIRGAKLTGIPDSFVPFLIWEYGLGELLPYLTDPRRAIAEGIGWQRVRGTPASLVQALDWIDVVAAIEEGDPDRVRWYWYQLGLAEPASFADVDRIVGISDISAPVRSHLIRIYAGLDQRRTVAGDRESELRIIRTSFISVAKLEYFNKALLCWPMQLWRVGAYEHTLFWR